MADAVGAGFWSSSPLSTHSNATSSPPSGSTETTPPSLSSPRARPISPDVGSTSPTISRSAAHARRRRCSTIRGTGTAPIRGAPGPVVRGFPSRCVQRLRQALCARSQARPHFAGRLWSHARRPFFIFADLEEAARRKAAGKKPVVVSPIALEVVRQIDALFEIEREINGQLPAKRRAVRQALSKPISSRRSTPISRRSRSTSPGPMISIRR